MVPEEATLCYSQRNLLDHISAPGLQKLRMHVTHGGSIWDNIGASKFSPQLSGFLQRSSCSLTHLHLEVSDKLLADDLVALLSSDTTTFDLTTLILENFPDVQILCRFLLPEADLVSNVTSTSSVSRKACVLPRLTHLVSTWRLPSHYRSPNGTMARMLRWRFKEGGLKMARILPPEAARVRDREGLSVNVL